MQSATTTNPNYVLNDSDPLMGESTSYVLRVRDLPLHAQPREKLLAHGPSDLTMAELVSVLLGVGTKREEVMVMAKRILKEYGERVLATEPDPAKLAASIDIPLTKACQIVACFELGRRMFDVKAGRPVYVRTAEQAYRHLGHIGQLQKEQLRGLYLNSRYQIIHEETISIGSLTANIVHPREVFRPAIEHGAVAIIVAHNHPSGNSSPTEADHDVTSQLVATGKILGIELLDHLIVAGDAFVSIINSRGDLR